MDTGLTGLFCWEAQPPFSFGHYRDRLCDTVPATHRSAFFSSCSLLPSAHRERGGGITNDGQPPAWAGPLFIH